MECGCGSGPCVLATRSIYILQQVFKEPGLDLSLDEGNKTHERNTQKGQAPYRVASAIYPIPAETNSSRQLGASHKTVIAQPPLSAPFPGPQRALHPARVFR